MGIGDILSSHKPATEKEESKKTKERVEEIVKELVPEPPAKPRGRPRKNSTEDPPKPKSPIRPPIDTGFPSPQQQSAEEIADSIANKAIIRKLRVYCKRFPQHSPPSNYNPHLHTAAQNRMIIEAIKEAVRADVESLTAPALVSDTIRNGEGMAMAWALTHTDHPASGAIAQLHNAADALLKDPAIDMDIGLLECEISGFLPESPYLRLLINGIRVLSRVFTENHINTVMAPGKEEENKFAEF